MQFTIQHRSLYNYSQPVRLGPHQLRFHPRDDGAQRVIEYQLEVSPRPRGRNEHIDLEGNRVTQVWFATDTDHLEVNASIRVETRRHNPFDFILDQTAVSLPIALSDDAGCVAAYLRPAEPDDAVTAFAAELGLAVEKDTLRFLDRLNRELFAGFDHVHRETGDPQSVAATLQTRRGACRDLAVLFVDCCRAEGLPARFASGYQKGNLQSDRRHLHAWPEVYLPGAGWRGFDPTHGQAIADTHVTVAAAARPQDTLPLNGAFLGGDATGSLDYDVQIEVSD